MAQLTITWLCGCSNLWSNNLMAITERAAGGPFHDRLLAFQLDVWVISLAESAIPVARHEVADFSQPHFPKVMLGQE
jgi:hypothetical protein